MFFGNDPRPGDTEHIVAEKDEYVVNRNAARKHKSLLDFINYVDEPRFDDKEMAHSAIDEAIALNTMSEVGMQGGGRIKRVDEFPVGGIGVAREQLSEDKRDRKGGYSLGVKDYYAQALGEFEKMGDFVGGATGSNRRNILEAAQEAGSIMETQEALNALKLIADRHQQGTMNVMSAPRQFQGGGSLSYGGQESEVPTLESIYEMAGVEPNAENKEMFESMFEYDPEDENLIIDKYTQGVEDFRTAGSDTLASISKDAESAGKGFATAGARGQMMEEGRSGLQSQYQSEVTGASRGMFEDIKDKRQSMTADAIQFLNSLKDTGGTVTHDPNADYDPGEQSTTLTVDHSSAPSNPNVGDEYNENSNGQKYKWTSYGSWTPTSG